MDILIYFYIYLIYIYIYIYTYTYIQIYYNIRIHPNRFLFLSYSWHFSFSFQLAHSPMFLYYLPLFKFETSWEKWLTKKFKCSLMLLLAKHEKCLKSVLIRSYFLYLYRSVFSRVWTEYEEILCPNTNPFYAVEHNHRLADKMIRDHEFHTDLE